MEQTHETGTESFEDGPITPTRIAMAAALMDVVAFAIIGHIALDDIAIGGITGLMVGLGVYCFLPLFLLADEDGLGTLAPADDAAPLRGFHRLAAGLALSGGGMVLFATGFMELELFVGLAAAVVATGVGYLTIGFVLPNAKLPK
ncbi:hypothetical protein GS429_06670 [Natronorubrum sp. JWXQ-INN-674]|uniref:Uncharacterized protein n=1 Tax=Natronorubrum halalkaliphilum TaxID=2691917 RepID=A0A6B0VKN5_9EURY|nr:hypothetical protein [Natronorubrum halalkaliphilum]MXV61753.1 hypothetical protein [Natronorubrum halalkaliphilum]